MHLALRRRVAAPPLTEPPPCVSAAQEQAVEWLRQVHLNSSFQASHGPWLRSVPQLGELLGRELLTPDMIEMLDSETLVRP